MGCGGLCARGVGVTQKIQPGFPGFEDRLHPSTYRSEAGRGLELSSQEHPQSLHSSNSLARSGKDRTGTDADGVSRSTSFCDVVGDGGPKLSNTPISHLCFLAVPTSVTNVPLERSS